MTALLDAVDALTKPQRRIEEQEILEEITHAETGDHVRWRELGTQKLTVERLPLLEELYEMIRNSMEKNAGSASLASRRSLLDDEALFKFMTIASQIADWCRAVKVRPTGKPLRDLRAWYVATLKWDMSDAIERYYVIQLGKWARAIEGVLDRPRERDHPEPCPACGAAEWWRSNERFLRPLVTRYRPDDGDEMVSKARSFCRACEESWPALELAKLLGNDVSSDM